MSKLQRAVREKDSDQNKPTRYFSKKQEDEIAKKHGGKRNANSGATMWSKGDVTLDQFLVECKTKTKKSESICIKEEWIKKNRHEALFMGKPYCTLAFNFGPNQENYYIIDEELFGYLIGFLNEKSK